MKRNWTASAKTAVVAALLVAALAMASGPAAAAVPAMYGARAMGMGGAYTAVAEDASALFWNPAALGLGAMSATATLGLSGDGNLADFQQLADNPGDLETLLTEDGKSSLGVGLLAGINLGSIGAGYFVDGTARVEKDQLQFSGDMALRGNVALGFARDIAGDGRSGFLGLRAGIVLRSVQVEQVFYETDATGNTVRDESRSGQGYGVDLGARFRMTEAFSIGLTARNVAGSTTWEGGATESPATEFHIGAALEPPLFGGIIAAEMAPGGEFRYGLEKKLLFGGLKLRAGQVLSDAGSVTTAGVGFALGPIAVDAAIIHGAADALHYTVEASVRF